MDNRKGSILIIALWSLCLLATFAVSIGYGVRQKATLAKRLDERSELRLIAEAGARIGIAKVKKMGTEKKVDYDALNDEEENGGLFRDIDIGGGKCNVCYDYINEESGTIESRPGIVDEERKININKAGVDVLGRLFQVLLGLDGIEASEIAASIVDWRDADNEISSPGGAEDSYYKTLHYPYGAKNTSFEVLDEVLLVKGMTSDIFERVKDYITIYSSGKVNINTASKAVLLTLGFKREIAEKIIMLRIGEDGILGTSDDKFFGAAGEVVPVLTEACHLNPSEVAQITAVAENLTTESENFMIRSIAKLNGRKSTMEVICVTDSKGNILNWREI